MKSGGITPVGIDYTEYRVDGGNWETYSSPLFLTLEGVHTLEYRSRDLLANPEPAHSIQIVVDDTPPTTSISIGNPNYQADELYVTSSTEINLTSTDGGVTPVGLDVIEYRTDGGRWLNYTFNITLAGADVPRRIEYTSKDILKNTEDVRNITVFDNTPPATTLLPATGPYTIDTLFNLTATDTGSGVNVTRYRIDGGEWTNYTTGFTLTEGVHNISYYSIDNLGNREAERWRNVTMEGAPPPPPPPEVVVNHKPLVAALFAIILAVVGLWSSRRRPWKDGKGNMAVVKAFTRTSMPFVIAEAVTGVVSHFTGALPIPPPIGLGTAVDSAILLIGLMVEAARISRPQPSLAVFDPSSDGEH